METRTPAPRSTAMKRGEVNRLPRSVLKMPVRPNRAKVSSSASRQNSTSTVFDTRRASTLGVARSITAAR